MRFLPLVLLFGCATTKAVAPEPQGHVALLPGAECSELLVCHQEQRDLTCMDYTEFFVRLEQKLAEEVPAGKQSL